MYSTLACVYVCGCAYYSVQYIGVAYAGVCKGHWGGWGGWAGHSYECMCRGGGSCAIHWRVHIINKKHGKKFWGVSLKFRGVTVGDNTHRFRIKPHPLNFSLCLHKVLHRRKYYTGVHYTRDSCLYCEFPPHSLE